MRFNAFQAILNTDFKIPNSPNWHKAVADRKKIELNEWTIRMLLMAKTCLVFIVGQFFRGFASFWTMAAEILI